MNLVYDEVEIAIQEGNPPFAAIITDSHNNILAVAHNNEINKKTTPKLNVHGGFMKDIFIEQIRRGRSQAPTCADQTMRNFGDIQLKRSEIGQFDDQIGAFANRDFRKGEELSIADNTVEDF